VADEQPDGGIQVMNLRASRRPTSRPTSSQTQLQEKKKSHDFVEEKAIEQSVISEKTN
jgi:hypothetical protein